MFVFAIFSTNDAHNAAIATSASTAYPSAFFEVKSGIWLVADNGVTAEEVAKKLNIVPGGIGTAMVLKIDGYHGFAAKGIWDWLAAKTGAP